VSKYGQLYIHIESNADIATPDISPPSPPLQTEVLFIWYRFKATFDIASKTVARYQRLIVREIPVDIQSQTQWTMIGRSMGALPHRIAQQYPSATSVSLLAFQG